TANVVYINSCYEVDIINNFYKNLTSERNNYSFALILDSSPFDIDNVGNITVRGNTGTESNMKSEFIDPTKQLSADKEDYAARLFTGNLSGDGDIELERDITEFNV